MREAGGKNDSHHLLCRCEDRGGCRPRREHQKVVRVWGEEPELRFELQREIRLGKFWWAAGIRLGVQGEARLEIWIRVI